MTWCVDVCVRGVYVSCTCVICNPWHCKQNGHGGVHNVILYFSVVALFYRESGSKKDVSRQNDMLLACLTGCNTDTGIVK